MADEDNGKRSKGTDPPRCKVCGARHWLHEQHQFGAVRATAKPKAVAPPPANAKAKPQGKTNG